MTLEEAILHLRESLADPAHEWGCEECKAEHEQLLAFLQELKLFRETFGDVKNTKFCIPECKEGCENLVKQYEGENEELKRLLRLALESFDFISDKLIPYTGSMRICDFAMLRANPFDNCFNCPLSNAKHKYCKWRYYDEAMKLLGGADNAEN